MRCPVCRSENATHLGQHFELEPKSNEAKPIVLQKCKMCGVVYSAVNDSWRDEKTKTEEIDTKDLEDNTDDGSEE